MSTRLQRPMWLFATLAIVLTRSFNKQKSCQAVLLITSSSDLKNFGRPTPVDQVGD